MSQYINIKEYQKKLRQDPKNINDIVKINAASLIGSTQTLSAISKIQKELGKIWAKYTVAGLIDSYLSNKFSNIGVYGRIMIKLREPTKQEKIHDMYMFGKRVFNKKYNGPKRLDYVVFNVKSVENIPETDKGLVNKIDENLINWQLNLEHIDSNGTLKRIINYKEYNPESLRVYGTARMINGKPSIVHQNKNGIQVEPFQDFLL